MDADVARRDLSVELMLHGALTAHCSQTPLVQDLRAVI